MAKLGGSSASKDILQTCGRWPEFSPHMDHLQLTRRRPQYARLPLTLGPGVTFGVSVYHIIHQMKKPTPLMVDSKHSNLLKVETSWLCASTGCLLNPHEVKTGMRFGSSVVPLSKNDITELKTFTEPGLTMLGFKPLDALADYHQVRSPLFLYPCEEGGVYLSQVTRDAFCQQGPS